MFINIHTHKREKRSNYFEVISFSEHEFSENETNRLSAISLGIHPWYIEKDSFSSLSFKVSSVENIIAIGECGLDKNIETPFEKQVAILKKQIDLSEKVKLPLVIHCVKSYNEIITLKKSYNPVQNWLIHGYNKSLELAQELIMPGFYIGIGAKLLQFNPERFHQLILRLPIEQIFFETDTFAASIMTVYEKAAEILSLEINVLEEIITMNLNNFRNGRY